MKQISMGAAYYSGSLLFLMEGNIMTQQSIAKKGILINTVLIIATVVAFLVIRITNYVIEYSYTDTDIALLFNVQSYTCLLYTSPSPRD